MEASEDNKLLIDFGLQPVSNRFLHDGNEQAPKFPLGLVVNKKTGLVSLDNLFPVEEVRPRFGWITCFEPEDHLDDLVKKLINLPGISKSSVVGGYSFKDNSTLKRLDEHGYNKTWVIDPKVDLNVLDESANVETYQKEFTIDKAKKINSHHGSADIMIVRHVLEHAYNISEFIKAVGILIKTHGYIVLEVPDCERAFIYGDCTIVWEEHTFYFTEFTFKQLIEQEGFEIVDYYSVPYPLENSIIAIVKKSNVAVAYDPKSLDHNIVMKEINKIYNFSNIFFTRKVAVREKLSKIKKHGDIVLFGAGHLSVAYISIMGIADLIEYVIDDNLNKRDMFMPIGGLRIVGSNFLYKGNISVCLLSLNPKNHNNVINNHHGFLDNGGVFASIFPDTNNYLEDTL